MARSEQFAAAPQAVPPRLKYRDDDVGGRPTNIMNDRRVMRGNTYASLVAPQDDAEIQKHREAQNQRLRRANQRKQVPGTPEPIAGRKHMDIQTDTYLEELTDRTIAFEAETMTDFLLDRPPSPLFMPAKIGVEMETQIEEGDLFDFDQEVELMLQVLVGKTLEVSMIEVLEEEEIATMRRHQQEYEQMRTQEMLEVQRIEEQERRRTEECQRRKRQLENMKELELQLKNKITSRQLARTYLSSLKARTMDTLQDMGLVAKEPSARAEIECKFMPWLIDQAAVKMKDCSRNKQIAEALTANAVMQVVRARREVIAQAKAELDEVENAERRMQMEEEEARRLEEMEAERIENEARILEEQRAAAEEVEVIDLVVAEEEGQPPEVKLEDESAPTISAELLEELTAKWAEKGEDRVFLAVNKEVLIAFSVRVGQPPAPPEEEAVEGEAEEAPPEEEG